jgi:PHD/YefM family antitoxin component YafN of YafNO toxin-antitoxin module
MQLLTANQAKTQFGQMIDMAQRAPVQITRHERVVGVVVSGQDYEDMRRFYANRLQQNLLASGAAAQAAGLDDQQLAALLSDES